ESFAAREFLRHHSSSTPLQSDRLRELVSTEWYGDVTRNHQSQQTNAGSSNARNDEPLTPAGYRGADRLRALAHAGIRRFPRRFRQDSRGKRTDNSTIWGE